MSLIPPNPVPNEPQQAASAEHCFHAFDALYCALTPKATPIEPDFVDEKL